MIFRLIVMTVLSVCVFLGAYYIKTCLGTVILAALAGYLLSTDLGGLGSQLSVLINRNKVSASKTRESFKKSKEKGMRFLWKWGMLEIIYHTVMLTVVGVVAGK